MENLFQQFQGADLDRLIECIKAVRAAGLTIDKYTQAIRFSFVIRRW